jgi:hypothetical protein
MKKISQNDWEMLWGEGEPYSEVKLITNTRILGDSVSRVMIEVEANINPTTFKIIKKNINLFIENEIILQLISHARYMGKGYGYLVSAGEPEELTGPEVFKRAQEKVDYTEKAIIEMHEFVMEYLEIKN